MARIDRYVQDLEGREYALVTILGRGGQGRVYTVEGGKLAVKLLQIPKSDSETRRNELHRKIASVRRLPLDNMPVARPLEMLREPHSGYVMELMTDMVPISHLLSASNTMSDIDSTGHSDGLSIRQNPNYSPDVFVDKPLIGWYVRTGSLRRRLKVLAHAADALSKLHAMGLVYGDVSRNNVFVSLSNDVYEIWLIDTDNLHYQSAADPLKIHTPRYGAPEVIKERSGVNSLSDTYSFAVLAFETLALVHPFLGDTVCEGDPDLETKALQGEMPWVEHPDDGSNRSSNGITPRDWAVSPRLGKLFQKTFVNGLNDPLERPSIAQWADYLHAAADLTLDCQTCGGSHYFDLERCPWCGSRRMAHALVSIKLCHPEDDVNKELSRRTIAGLSTAVPGTLVLSRRIVTGHVGANSSTPALKIEFTNQGKNISASNLDGGKYWFETKDGKRRNDVRAEPRRFAEDWTLHMGLPDRLHRIALFKVMSG